VYCVLQQLNFKPRKNKSPFALMPTRKPQFNHSFDFDIIVSN